MTIKYTYDNIFEDVRDELLFMKGKVMKNIHLVCIDAQLDFCDPKGALFVKGADTDMIRLAGMVNRLSDKLTDIHATLDSHHLVDVAHPIYWKDSNGNHPSPFTLISDTDVESGKWMTTLPSLQKRALSYVKTLKQNGRYVLCIWPPHCLISSWGHGLVPVLFDAFKSWENKRFAMVDYVTKGSNIHTEHYSALSAECPDPVDPSTQINTRLINTLEEADEIPFAGEASSHCVANSLYDLLKSFKDNSYAKKIVLLADAMSPVPGFESLQDKFFQDMKSAGVRFSTTQEYLA